MKPSHLAPARLGGLYTAVVPLLALLAAPAALAQSGQYLHLSPGDTLSVSSAGTIGTVGGSPVVMPSATSYTGSGYPDQTVDNYGHFTLGSGGSLTNPRSQGGYGILTQSNGTVTITGGSVLVGDNSIALGATDSSRVSITGGTITAGNNGKGVFAFGGNMVTIAGGVITVGQGGTGLDSSFGTTIDLFGSNFAYTANGITTQITSGFLPSNGFGGTITGTFLNGDRLNTTFGNDGILGVNVGTPPVIAPEPSPALVFGLGILSLGMIAFRRARQFPGTSD